MANPQITFSAKQVQKTYVSNGIRKHYMHSKRVDKEGQPLKMCRIILPDKDHRAYQFDANHGVVPEDHNGIDVNDRKAYIQVPQEAVYSVTNKDGKETMQRYMYVNNSKASFTVYFEAKLQSNGQFDKPGKVVVGLKELKEIFPDISKEKSKTAEKTTEKKKEQKKEKKTEKKAPKKTKNEKSITAGLVK